MLDSLYSVTMLTAAMAVLCALLECMIPQGKLKSTVLLAIGVIFLLSIAAPIAGLLQEDLPSVAVDTQTDSNMQAELPTHEELLRSYYEESAADMQ